MGAACNSLKLFSSCAPALRNQLAHASSANSGSSAARARGYLRGTPAAMAAAAAGGGGEAGGASAGSSGDQDTIAAIVTAVAGQQAGVAIVRLSGPSAVDVAGRIFRPAKKGARWQPESHRVEYGWAVDEQGAVIDEVLLIPMLAPRSFTREDVVELHTHGGTVCGPRVLGAALSVGARLAHAGEFTLRAFLNGRLDLAQAESVAALVAARTHQAADSALSSMQGGLSGVVKVLRAECVDLLVEAEARLDFDEDLPPLDEEWLVQRIDAMWQQLEQALATAKRGQLLQSGMVVAIVGRPNVGKSSLLNAWSQRGTSTAHGNFLLSCVCLYDRGEQSERAIVTEVAGTTRDVVEARVAVGGIPVRVLDTAGIRATHDVVEAIGVRRSEQVVRGADVILMVVTAADGWTADDDSVVRRIWGDADETAQRQQDQQQQQRHHLAGPSSSGHPPPSGLESVQEALPPPPPQAPAILVVNKVDQGAAHGVAPPERVRQLFSERVATCALSGSGSSSGMDALEQAVLRVVGAHQVAPEGQQWAVNQRQAEMLVRASEALVRLRQSVQSGLPVDFWTIDIREAAMALGQISGDDVTEEVLSHIFSRFCIGK
eukprot:jgi/Mesen1/4033/ME000212S03056